MYFIYVSPAVAFICIFMSVMVTSVTGIDCYQCSSRDHLNPFQCNEYMTDDKDIEPQSCDNVYNAAYCIKRTGRFEVGSINCYQCSTPLNIDCGDILIHDADGNSLAPTSCDHLFEAEYCIKTTGLYNGGLGTQRFCSSLDLGNYCSDVKQPGDQLDYYRSCVYTCSSDGCNGSSSLNISHFHVGSIVLLYLFFRQYLYVL